tara:strand:- start:659 stop:922 length:264 start_codon:yes stop_codon:yes gene_type:complete
MKKLKNIIKLYTLCFVVVSFCFSCQEQPIRKKPKNTIYYVISYGGFFGGRFVTNNYKLKDGYYLFLSGKDSIRLKETLVGSVIKRQY